MTNETKLLICKLMAEIAHLYMDETIEDREKEDLRKLMVICIELGESINE